MEFLGFASPVYWLPHDLQDALAHFMILASFFHSLGIAINGNWRYSPALRVVGLSMHASVISVFVYSGAFSSASYTYAWIFAALMYGVVSAFKDLYNSLTVGEY